MANQPIRDAYQNVWDIEAGFAQIGRALAGMATTQGFHRAEVARFRLQCEEARAATSSYLLGVLEHLETRSAGRLYRRRRRQERKEEQS